MAADQDIGQAGATMSKGRDATSCWGQAVVVTLLAWIALCCTGLGAATGAGSQTLANKLAAQAQHLQRHGGGSLAQRAARRDHPAATSIQQVAEAPRTLVLNDPELGLPTDKVTQPIGTRRTVDATLAVNGPYLKPFKRAHPSRAPPGLA